MQGTREDDPRENVVTPAPPAAALVNDDLTAIYTKRRLSTEVLGRARDKRGSKYRGTSRGKLREGWLGWLVLENCWIIGCQWCF